LHVVQCVLIVERAPGFDKQGGGLNKEIAFLLSLQEKDLKQAKLAAQIDRFCTQKKQIEQRLLEAHTALNQLREELEQLERDSRLKNLEVDDLDMQIREYQKQLDEGIISYKEMEALRTKIVHQRQRISEMEDEALALMDRIEAARQHLKKREEDVRGTEETLKTQSAKIDQQIEQIQSEKALGEAERTEIVAKIRPHLSSRYEALHAKCEDPVVAITGGTCAGCNLKVSASTLERARNGAEIIQCENCSRILYTR
jgi:predicted  nucleic acid-binding Zn-ribbon protein